MTVVLPTPEQAQKQNPFLERFFRRLKQEMNAAPSGFELTSEQLGMNIPDKLFDEARRDAQSKGWVLWRVSNQDHLTYCCYPDQEYGIELSKD